MNKSQFKAGALALLLTAALAACNDDGSMMPSATRAPPATTNFETFTNDQVQLSTCETLAETDINGLDFSFPMDQDSSDAQDVSMVSPACKAS